MHDPVGVLAICIDIVSGSILQSLPSGINMASRVLLLFSLFTFPWLFFTLFCFEISINVTRSVFIQFFGPHFVHLSK